VIRILDRYLIREIALPFFLGLVLLTFVLEIPPILRDAEALIAKGVEWNVIFRVLLTLLPQALALTIPMAVLLGILIGFGRVSGDREFVAMQACGVSLLRLLRPVTLVAVIATLATAHQIIIALPEANQTYREITFGIVASRVEQNVRPRVFFEDFPDKVIYVRDLPPDGGWREVFLADTARPDQTTVYFAKEGRILIDREKQVVQLQLIDGTSHTTSGARPEEYERREFDRISIILDPTTVFRRPPPKGPPEKTFAELRATIDEAAKQGQPAYSERFMYHYKLALPATCPILALIGLALGASARKDGRLASFVLGFSVILVYYILLYGARAFAMGGQLDPGFAPWIPNIIMGIAAIVMLVWRSRSADRPIRFSVPAFWARRGETTSIPATSHSPARRRAVIVLRLPQLNLPRPRLLDMYVSREYLRVFLLAVLSLLGIFYISTFIDLADKLFRGSATTRTLLEYFYFQTPQFVYYVIPMGVLVATLVTLGILTKNSEILVMRACGVSLYRTALPLLVFALAGSAALFGMQEQVLATANREADRLNRLMRGFAPQTTALNRRWVVGQSGEMYHFDFFDALANRFSRLRVYHFDPQEWRLRAMTYAEDAVPAPDGEEGAASPLWAARHGWRRDFAPGGAKRPESVSVRYTSFDQQTMSFDPPSYFKSDMPDAEMMNYGQLRDYIARLKGSGAYVVPYMVALERKVAFPFVTVIMTLLAVPFAVTTGRRGALYGIGIGIVLAMVYWITLSLFGALGAGGVLDPLLAAWAPNILFGAAAAFMNLTVRT
jgi:LPS export ABC transporter permease LptG/LPS export ABC transporter permease LptF